MLDRVFAPDALAVDFAGKGLPLVGDLPRGLPSPAMPDVGWETARSLLGASLGVAFVAFADTSVLSRTYAVRTRTYVDPNQEMVGLGLANVAAGFFQGFPISTSSSRTAVAEDIGARSQLTGLIGAGILAPWIARAELESGSLVSLPLGPRPLARRGDQVIAAHDHRDADLGGRDHLDVDAGDAERRVGRPVGCVRAR